MGVSLCVALLVLSCDDSPGSGQPDLGMDIDDGDGSAVDGADGMIDTSPDVPTDLPDDDGDAQDDDATDVSVDDTLSDTDDADAQGDIFVDGALDALEPLGEGVILELIPLDLWAQPIPDAQLIFGPTDDEAFPLTDRPVAQFRLSTAGRYQVTLVAEHHDELYVEIDYDGSSGLHAVTVDGSELTGREGLLVVRSERVVDGFRESVVSIYMGLRHRWFAASGRPPRRGNQAELLTDGEQAWGTVHGRLLEASESVHMASWWWESSFELLRPRDSHIQMSEAERRQNTILYLLDSSPATARVLVWQDNLLDWLTVDDEIEDRGSTPDDNFEFMGMTNSIEGVFWWEIDPIRFGARVTEYWPEVALGEADLEVLIPSEVSPREVDISDFPLGLSIDIQIASWHQKFMIIDGDEAFVGGMNVKGTDWDTSDHLVYEPRRMEFDASTRDRLDVVARESEPDLGPRKDYMVHLMGPIVQDVAEVFQRRWHHQIEIGREFSENASTFEINRDLETFEDGVTVQVTTTMPAPFHEYSNIESMRNAVLQAEDYIYIEDQYWRAPILSEAIIERMNEVDDLILIVVTKPVSEWFDPACEWTHRTHEDFQTRFPDRYFLYQLRVFDYVETWGWDETESRFLDLDTHSKMLIVDDVFMSVGSCNKNNRGYLYEGEINVAILDHDFVRDARRRIISNILQAVSDTDDSATWLAQLEAAASLNGAVYDRWDDEGWDISLDGDPLPDKYRPIGFLYPLSFRSPDDCFIEGIGADVMK